MQRIRLVVGCQFAFLVATAHTQSFSGSVESAAQSYFYSVDVQNDDLYRISHGGVAVRLGPLGIDVQDARLAFNDNVLYMVARVAGKNRAYQVFTEGAFRGRAFGGAEVLLGGNPVAVAGITERGTAGIWLAFVNGSSTQYNRLDVKSGSLFGNGFSIGLRFDALGFDSNTDWAWRDNGNGTYLQVTNNGGWIGAGTWAFPGSSIRDLSMFQYSYLMGIDSAFPRLVKVPKSGLGGITVANISGIPGNAVFAGLAKTATLYGIPLAIGLWPYYWMFEQGYGVVSATFNSSSTAASAVRPPVAGQPLGYTGVGLAEGFVPGVGAVNSVLYAAIENSGGTGFIAQVATQGELAGSFVVGPAVSVTQIHSITTDPNGILVSYPTFNGQSGFGYVNPVTGVVTQLYLTGGPFFGLAAEKPASLTTLWGVGPIFSPTNNAIYRKDGTNPWGWVATVGTPTASLKDLAIASQNRLVSTHPGHNALYHFPKAGGGYTSAPVTGGGVTGNLSAVARKTDVAQMTMQSQDGP